MAVTSRLEIRGIISGLASGKKNIGPLVRSDATGATQTTQLTLASGFNEIAVPTNCSGVLIIFAITSTVTKVIKGVTGDTGITLDPGTSAAGTNMAFLPFNPASPPATFGITTNGVDTGLVTEFVWF